MENDTRDWNLFAKLNTRPEGMENQIVKIKRSCLLIFFLLTSPHPSFPLLSPLLPPFRHSHHFFQVSLLRKKIILASILLF